MNKNIVIVILFTLIFSSCKKQERTYNKEWYKDVKKFELLNDTAFILTTSGLFSLKADSNLAENVIFADSLYPLDISVIKGKLYVIGIEKYKLKMVKKENGEWIEIPLPEQITNNFINKTVDIHNKYYFFKKEEMFNSDDTDNFRKEEKLQKIMTDKMFLTYDKSLILITYDTVYYKGPENWVPVKFPESPPHSIEFNIPNIKIVKDSIFYIGHNGGEWGGVFARLDFRDVNPKWNYFDGNNNYSGIFVDSIRNCFWYSSNLENSYSVKWKLSYYKDGKDTSLINNYDEADTVIFKPHENSRIIHIEKINDKFYILTNSGMLLYEKNEIKMLFKNSEIFVKFKVDNKENILVTTNDNALLKFTKSNNGYEKSNVFFITYN